MPKYRKKPVIIDAIQLRWDTWETVCDFVPRAYFGGGIYLDDSTREELPEGHTSNTLGLRIETLEGIMLAKQDDYIIRGVKGEFYPVNNDIFLETYEVVEEEDGHVKT